MIRFFPIDISIPVWLFSSWIFSLLLCLTDSRWLRFCQRLSNFFASPLYFLWQEFSFHQVKRAKFIVSIFQQNCSIDPRHIFKLSICQLKCPNRLPWTSKICSLTFHLCSSFGASDNGELIAKFFKNLRILDVSEVRMLVIPKELELGPPLNTSGKRVLPPRSCKRKHPLPK